jgi:hypothetical protein
VREPKNELELQRQLADELAPYRFILEALVREEMSPGDFETEYFEMYAEDPRGSSDEVFDIVDAFFADVDAYVDDEGLRDPAAGDLGPDELRERARELLRRAGHEV